MPRFKNRDTGSIVDVDDATAETLGREWAPITAEPTPAKATKPRRTASRPADSSDEE